MLIRRRGLKSTLRFRSIAALGAALISVQLGATRCAFAVDQTENLPQSLETQPLMIRTAAGKQHFFTVEVADDPDEQRTGLMFRTELAPDKGMIFVYSKPRQIGMWMKNTRISLDMLFIDAAGRIVNIYEGATPGSLASIRSKRPSVAVIELAAGKARSAGLREGDQVFHCAFKNFPCETAPAQ